MAGQDIILTNRNDGFKLGAYHAAPRADRRGGLVLIQEIFGVDATMRALSDDFAGDGFEVIAPSLFDRRYRGFHADHDEAGIKEGVAAAMAVDWTQALGDIQAAIDALQGPVFVAGFCWGGGATWLAACRCAGLTAAASFYGRLVSSHLNETPKVPVVFHYGAEDAGIPLQGNVDQVQAAMAPPSAVYVYEGAGHAFMAERAYHEPSARLAKHRTLEFFADPSKSPA